MTSKQSLQFVPISITTCRAQRRNYVDGFLRTIERLLFLGLSELRGLVSAFLIGVFCV